MNKTGKILEQSSRPIIFFPMGHLSRPMCRHITQLLLPRGNASI